jgi:SPP1 family phage portal protein
VCSSDLVEKLLLDLGRDFKKKLKAYAIEASKKGRAHFQTYIKDGKFNYKLINSEQIVVCYDEEEVDAIIHFYEKGEEKFAQLLTKASVSDWILKGDTYYLLGEIRPSIVLKTLVDGRIQGQSPESWGMMPITVTYNNDDKQTDLEPVRASIDIYDIINSDFANNLDDFQDVYWVLQGFQGESLEDFLKQVKQLKAIKVGEGGNAHMETIDIPVDARKTLMEITEDNIFKFGMGLNTEKIAGGSLTNVVIKARYADLDLKANDFEQEIKEGIYQLLDLLNVYYKITNQPTFTLDEIDITFDRSSLINQEELSRLANESVGKLSEETRLANDPRVTDVEMEVKAMKELQDDMMKSMETSFGGGE